MHIYSRDFFQTQQDGSRKSAGEVVPMILKLVRPQSVVDVGCGVGTWLAVFREYGIQDVLGIDGDYVETGLLQFPPEFFRSHDLSQPLQTNRQFDLVVSLEVAEHLPPASAEVFIESLTTLGPAVLFSAAVPHQAGTSHLNEQWPDYWVELFKRKGYRPVDCLRRQLWHNENVAWWYAQNTILYVKQANMASYELLEKQTDTNDQVLSLVHPKLYLQLQYCADPDNMSVRTAWAQFRSVIKRAVYKRIRIEGKKSGGAGPY